MRARTLVSSFFVLGSFAATLAVGCGSPNYSRGPDVTGTDAGPSPDAGPVGPGSLKCDATEAEVYGDPGDLSALANGAVIRCKDDGILTKEQLKTTLKAIENETILDEGKPTQTTFTNKYEGRDPVSDTHVYRVLYKTTRANGSASGAAGFSVATVYVPVTPIAEKLPLVLLARGSRGQAPSCAPSVNEGGAVVNVDNKDGNYVHDDYVALAYPLAGAGFAVVATDNAGYSPFNYGKASNLPSGYAQLDDVARSFLDSAYPLQAALGDKALDKMVLVGLSQGGHTILGSLEAANTYTTAAPIVGVAAYAPLWYTQRSWGITMTQLSVDVAGVVLNKSAGVPGAIWYHYSHAELLDGPGEGEKLFKPQLRPAVKKWFESICWSKTYAELAASLPTGAQGSSADFFSDEMTAAIGGGNLVFGRNCDGSPNAALCNKWLDRYKADHPVHTAKAKDVPILLAYGLKDTTIPKDRFACVVDKLKEGRSAEQFGKVEYCVNGNAGHGGSVLLESDYVNDWIKSKAFGTPAPAANATACPQSTWDGSIACDSLLPND